MIEKYVALSSLIAETDLIYNTMIGNISDSLPSIEARYKNIVDKCSLVVRPNSKDIALISMNYITTVDYVFKFLTEKDVYPTLQSVIGLLLSIINAYVTGGDDGVNGIEFFMQ